MRTLLDTHTFLWAYTEPKKLSRRVRDLLEDGTNDVYLSAVSVWEVAIKDAKGLLRLPEHPARFVPARMTLDNLQALPVEIAHAIRVADLPRHHNDPFDRLLIAQSQLENLPILTSDANIARYDVEVIW